MVQQMASIHATPGQLLALTIVVNSYLVIQENVLVVWRQRVKNLQEYSML